MLGVDPAIEPRAWLHLAKQSNRFIGLDKALKPKSRRKPDGTFISKAEVTTPSRAANKKGIDLKGYYVAGAINSEGKALYVCHH